MKNFLRPRFLSAFGWLLLFAPALASGQGSAEDYARANAVRDLARGKLFGEQLELTWALESKRVTWTRAPQLGAREVRSLDLETGSVVAAFDHVALADLARAAGLDVGPDRLPIVGLEYLDESRLAVLLDVNSSPHLFLSSEEGIRKSPLVAGGPFTLKRHGARRSGAGRGDTSVVFFNSTLQAVQLEWIDGGGQRRNYGTLEPGASKRQNTHVGHVWELVGAAEESLGFYTARKNLGCIAVPSEGLKGSQPPVGNATEGGQGRGRFEWLKGSLNWIDAASGEATPLELPEGYAGHRLQPTNSFSPDAAFVVVFATTDSDGRQVHLLESAPADRLQPRLKSIRYDKPGDGLAQRKPLLFDVKLLKLHAIDDALFSNPWSIDRLSWSASGEQLFLRYNQRGHQLLRWIGVEIDGLRPKVLLEESSSTFIDYSNKGYSRHAPARDELLWMSERSGFNHLYRYCASTGSLLNAVTQGDWVLRAVERVDETSEQLWFRAMGVYPEQDPYHVHYGRVNFDGSGLVWLTQGNGTHQLEFGPRREFYLDRYSRVDLPPVHELRRCSDGSLVAELGRADASARLAAGLSFPERFSALGRDGKTPIWGVIHRPTGFDSKLSYPVIEQIYAGPHGAFVPKAFQSYHGPEALSELGFIVVQIDGMGTNWRSKAFHDVAWKNLKDAGFPDRMAWLRAAASTRPWMDLGRVGIYGGSAGGQSALRAVLDHPDFYRAAAADCGCHDNRMDKVWWNEAWMGWPIDASYAASSNVVDAHKLGAPLLLTVGELDTNVDPASTMQVVKALIAADKDFELIVFPGAGHGAGGSDYGVRRRRDFFVRHLLGREPRW